MGDKSKLPYSRSSPGPSSDEAKRISRFAKLVQAMEDDEEDGNGKKKKKPSQDDIENGQLER